MKTFIYLFSISILFLGCTGDNFQDKKALHKKFEKLLSYENLSYGYSSSYKSGVSYKYISINFDVDDNLSDKYNNRENLAKKLAKFAFEHYKSEEDYDGIKISFEQKQNNTKVWEVEHQFSFEEL